MVQKIIWSPEALRTLRNDIDYLAETLTSREIDNFSNKVDEILSILERHPQVGSYRNKKLNIYSTIVHKKVILFYKYKPRKKEIILLNFWNVQQDPRKLRY